MKYIRTKYAIYESNQWVYDGLLRIKARMKYHKDNPDVIATANTIEELCDEFVYVASEKDRPVVCYKPTAFHKLSDNLYGAVWTDNGLIYVAKMNDKGELELL